MSLVPQKDLAALGLTSEMIGLTEKLPLPPPQVEEARGLVPRASSDVAPLDGYSDVMHTIGVDLRLDAETRALELEWAEDTGIRLRDAHPSATPYPGEQGLVLTVPLRQLGRFVIESHDGVPLVLGMLDADTLHLAAVGAWPSPPLAQWIPPMTDVWLQSIVERALPGADSWSRTALAGMITRLATPEPAPNEPAPGGQRRLPGEGGAQALLQRVSQSPTMRPRVWVRSLDRAALAALEEHARRRAIALEHDLDDLLALLPIDGAEATAAWTRVCHRRDDLEGVRLLLVDAGAGGALEAVLGATDRAGRVMRTNLGAGLAIDDERLRRVALGDPSAWWGDPDFDVRLL